MEEPACDIAPCRVVEVSLSGLRLEAPASVLEGCEVLVLVHHAVVFGTVRHCRLSPGMDDATRYQIGIHIDRVVAKSLDSVET